MEQEPITLNEVDKLISLVTRQGEFATASFLKTIRKQYRTDDDLLNLKSIRVKDLVKADTSNPAKYLSSLKTSINKNLEELFESEAIPFLLKVGESNTLICPSVKSSQYPKQKRKRSTSEQTGFRVSEITFNLPAEIHKEFKKNLEAVKKQRETLSKNLTSLLKSENALYRDKFEMESKGSASRGEVRKQMKNLRQGFDQERKLYQAEISSFNNMIQRMQTENKNLLIRQISDSDLRHKESKKHNNDLAKIEEKFKEQMRGLTKLMTSVNDSEKEFMDKLTREMERLSAKANELKQASEFQKNKQIALDARDRDLTLAKKSYRLQLDKDYKKKEDELHLSFSRRSEYHRQRSNEEKAYREKLEEEKSQLREREIYIQREIRDRAERKVSKFRKDFSKLTKDLNDKKLALEQEEMELSREKNSLLNNLPQKDESQNIIAFKLNSIIKDQEAVLRRKKDSHESLEKDRASMEEDFNKKFAELESEKAEIHSLLEQEKSSYLEKLNELKENEEDLIHRETNELQQLNDEYETLRKGIETERIEQGAGFDALKEQIHNEQFKLREKEIKIQEMEKKSAEKVAASEKEAHETLKEARKIKSSVMALQKEAEKFISETNKIFQNNIKRQTTDLKDFKNSIRAIESDARSLSENIKRHEEQTLKMSSSINQSLEGKLHEDLNLLENMESELQELISEYQSYFKEYREMKRGFSLDDKTKDDQDLSELADYETRLLNIGENFEKLSKSFHRELKRQSITILPEDYAAPLEYDEDLAKMEWTLAVNEKLENRPPQENSPLEDFRSKLADKWSDWVSIPAGEFLMGNERSRESAPCQKIKIAKPFKIKKFPVTNIEFFQFVSESAYKTEAENGLTGIVYHPGNNIANPNEKPNETVCAFPTFAPEEKAFWLCPDGRASSLSEKFCHPVTQITWNDALAYCQWMSQMTGKNIRLPNEIEWEYVASNLGQIAPDDFHWNKDEIARFCNIEETGIFGTTPVDHFDEHDLTAGTQDMFGNVHEWVMDSFYRNSNVEDALEYKIVRGGSYANCVKDIAQWRRFAFIPRYCSTFIGFRVICEED